MSILRALIWIPAVAVFAPLTPPVGDAGGASAPAIIESFRQTALSELARVKAELADGAHERGAAEP
jgi:hypothetical protein